jgi:hypothetical protein
MEVGTGNQSMHIRSLPMSMCTSLLAGAVFMQNSAEWKYATLCSCFVVRSGRRLVFRCSFLFRPCTGLFTVFAMLLSRFRNIVVL